MKIIAIRENNKLFYGSIPKIAKKIDMHPETIKRWIKAGKKLVCENDCEIFLDTEKL